MKRLPRKKKLVCPKCGSEDIKVVKTWQLVAPLPDKYGRITITVMGVFQCKQCEYKWRGIISKLKVGGSGVEIEGTGKKLGGEEKEERRVKEIVLDLDDLDLDEE